jgi:hypothetical protein
MLMEETNKRNCGEPAISLDAYHVSLVQWTTHLFPIMKDPGSIPRGVLTVGAVSIIRFFLLTFLVSAANYSHLGKQFLIFFFFSINFRIFFSRI